MFILRQLVEKKLTGGTGIRHRSERYDRDQVEVDGCPRAEVRMVKGTYEETKGREVCGPGISEEFRMVVGLGEGSALSQLLFIAVLEESEYKGHSPQVAIHR